MKKSIKFIISLFMMFVMQNIVLAQGDNTSENMVYKEYILKHNPKISKTDLNTIMSSVDKYSVRYNVPKILIYSMMKVESDFNKKTKSSANAVGVMQITRVLARDYKLNRDSMDGNIHIGVKYLRECMDEFGLTNNTVAAYNRGINGVKKYGYSKVKETVNHVRKVRAEIEYLNNKLGE